MISRRAFLDNKVYAECETQINRGAPFLFMPNDFYFNTKRGKSFLQMIGINKAGARVLVTLRDLPIFVDVEITGVPEKFIENIRSLGDFSRYEQHEMLPGKELAFKPRQYFRLYFDSIAKRRKFIIGADRAGVLTANCDKFELLFNRVARLDTCGWNEISNYSFVKSTKKIPFQLSTAYLNVAAKHCEEFFDRTMICAWDLETYTNSKFGGVPQPDKPSDVIKQCSMVFRWYWSGEDILRVLICSTVMPPIENVHVIIGDIPHEMARVIAAMQPDLMTGFNDGSYDWPFIRARIRDPKKFRQLICCQEDDVDDLCGPYLSSGRFRTPQIKIDAETMVSYNGWFSFGTIFFDTQNIMRKKDIKETKFKSLNSFLELYKLAPKEDMPYDYMARIFSMEEILRVKHGLDSYTKMIEFLELRGEEKIFAAEEEKMGSLKFTHYTASEILTYIKDLKRVALYCIRDSAACLDLLGKINVVPDLREIGTRAHTSLRMGFFNADGIKVRNSILFEAMKPKWGILEKKYPLAFKLYTEYTGKNDLKFPGGFVFEPELGLYIHSLYERRAARRGFDGPTTLLSDEELAPSSRFIPAHRKSHVVVDATGDSEKIKNYFKKLDAMSEEEFKLFCKNNDFLDCHSRPSSGLDFASLYPSIICCYNLSPEMYTKTNGNFPLLEISVNYKKEGEQDTESNSYHGYFYQGATRGIFPSVLVELFETRGKLKKQMGMWKLMLEKLEKEVPNPEKFDQSIVEFYGNLIAQLEQAPKSRLTKLKLDTARYARTLFAEHIPQFKNLDEFTKRAQFMSKYLDSKQNGVKIFMNTFYGEMGNSRSPFFIVEMAGGVTKMGRESTKAAQKFVEALGFHVYYGDTDSIYISAPENSFAEIDKNYELALSKKTSILDKEEFWNQMCLKTQDEMDDLVEKIAIYFNEKTGSKFLKMAYEEVLFPFFLFGKKNYCGVEHKDVINFAKCHETNAGQFIKGFFMRGIPIRRRDGSKFVRDQYAELLMKLFNIAEIRSVEQVVHAEILKLLNEQVRPVEDFIKNCSFRAPNDNTHTAQLRFYHRMRRLQIVEKANRVLSYLIDWNRGALNLQDFEQDLKYLYFYFFEMKSPFGLEPERFCGLETFWNAFEKDFKSVNIKIIDNHLLINDKKLLIQFEEHVKIGGKTFTVNQEWLGLEILVPVFGSRENLVYTNKPELLTDRGTKKAASKGDLLEYPALLKNAVYAKFLAYCEGFIGSVEINRRCYFEELFGKLSKFLCYLPKYYHADKKKIKDAITRDLNQKYEDYFTTITIDNSFLKNSNREIINALKQEFEWSPIIQILWKFYTDDKILITSVDRQIANKIKAKTVVNFNRNKWLEKNRKLLNFVRAKKKNSETVLFDVVKNKLRILFIAALERFRRGDEIKAILHELNDCWAEVIWRGKYVAILEQIAGGNSHESFFKAVGLMNL